MNILQNNKTIKKHVKKIFNIFLLIVINIIIVIFYYYLYHQIFFKNTFVFSKTGAFSIIHADIWLTWDMPILFVPVILCSLLLFVFTVKLLYKNCVKNVKISPTKKNLLISIYFQSIFVPYIIIRLSYDISDLNQDSYTAIMLDSYIETLILFVAAPICAGLLSKITLGYLRK